MEFRKDINGLRAIAVIAVVIFHFNPQWLPGGFAGVDVFFVISGFLMTKIIFMGLENDSFSILRFYYARAKRIIPALAALCFTLLVFGWFYLTPLDYQVLGKHVASSMGFLSNFVYWQESGYFDAASKEKWLLHTWSLSVEWQFYIIYPLILVVMKRFLDLRAMKFSILIATILGFVFCVIATYLWPDPSYYLLPTRAWEMMMGGVAFLFPLSLEKKNKAKLEAIGFVFILASYIVISKDNLWPGYLSFFSVVGAFFIIQSKRNDSVLTNNIVFQKLGLWSYSIYLWHWPVVILINDQQVINNSVIIYSILASILLGFISYQAIENKKIKQLYICFMPLFIGGGMFWLDGVPQRYNGLPSIQESIVSSKAYYKQNYNLNYTKESQNLDDMYTCSYDNSLPMEKLISCIDRKIDNGGYLIIGDSHGRDFFHSIRYAYPEKNFAMLHRSGCAPAKYQDICFPFMYDFIDYVNNNKKIKGVIFASRFYREPGIETFFDDVSRNLYLVDELFIVGSGPGIRGTVDSYVIKNGGVKDRYKIEKKIVSNILKVNKKLEGLAKSKNIKFYNKYDVFCIKDQCKLHDDNNEVFLFDNQHLSKRGIEYLGNAIKENVFLSALP